MRRALMLLALLAAGFGGGWSGDPIGVIGAPHEIAADAAASPGAFVRSASVLIPSLPEHGSGPGPRPLYRRSDGGIAPVAAPGIDAGHLAIRVRRTGHLHYAALFAAARAGLLSSPATAPPPFRLV